MGTSDNNRTGRVGFDAAIKSQEEDHLNRWPFAREIYGIAASGPIDWSVRVGIYGEWGTGKTSVLQFISEMARADEHIVISFNPWEHSNKAALWRAFVLTVFKEPAFAKLDAAKRVRVKGRLGGLFDRKKELEAGVGMLYDKAGKAVGAGLELVKNFFSFSQSDLKAVRGALGNKRVIILIDDLDRTAPELVPEILFALKELMDIPQFSFVCAFDPVVVGKVLRRYHAGFGDGLKFLEKVIDYPRWLPAPPSLGLVKLAISDARQYCPYVPETALRDVVPLLPANPRAVRQFIRLLSLLAPQIERHYDHELRWPVILAATALKVRYPLLGHDLLSDETLWGKLQEISFGAESRKEPQVDKNDLFSEHVKRITSTLAVQITPPQQEEIVRLLCQIFAPGNVLLWLDTDRITYQFNIAESPHAVTWKEYDQFVRAWGSAPNRGTAESWINDHARSVGRLSTEVQREVFQATIRRYAETLKQADNVLTHAEKTSLTTSAASLIAVLECLTFDLGQLNQPVKRLDVPDIELLFETFASMTNATSPVHAQFQPRNEQLLFRVVKEWSPDVTPLVNVLRPYGYYPGRHFDRERTKVLRQEMCAVLLVNFASQILNRIREPEFGPELFGEEKESYAIRGIIVEPKSPMWTTLRANTLGLFKEAEANRAIQENSYELIHFFD